MRFLQYVTVCLWMSLTSSERQTHISISHNECSGTLNIDNEETVFLSYQGAELYWCQFILYTEKPKTDVCVSPSKTDMGCSVKLYYSEGTYYPSQADKEFNCTNKPEKEWCTSRDLLYITLEKTDDTDTASELLLKINSKPGEEPSHSNKALLTGIAVGCTVFVLAVLVVVGYCVFMRKYAKSCKILQKKKRKKRQKRPGISIEETRMTTAT